MPAAAVGAVRVAVTVTTSREPSPCLSSVDTCFNKVLLEPHTCMDFEFYGMHGRTGQGFRQRATATYFSMFSNTPEHVLLAELAWPFRIFA